MLAIECENGDFTASQSRTAQAFETSATPIISLSNGISATHDQYSSIDAGKRAKNSVESHGVQESQTLIEGSPIIKSTFNEANDLDCSNGFNCYPGRTKQTHPSRLNSNFWASVFRDQGRAYAQPPPDNPSAYYASNNNFDIGLLPNWNNTMHLGYHTESNERTKVLPDNSNCRWRSNLIGQYNCPLSATSFTTPTPIVQTPLNNNTPAFPAYDIPSSFPLTASYPTSSYVLASHGDPLQHIGAQVNSNGVRRPAISTITDSRQPVTHYSHSRQPNIIKRRSMTQPSSEKATTAKKRPRNTNRSQNIPATNGVNSTSGRMGFTPEDLNRIQALIAAMNDMSASEDNDGMIRSWDKMRLSKVAKITAVCEELLIATKKAVALNGRPLCDRKRSSNKYATFEDRFGSLCKTLRTQKTVCKHLMEDPYMYQVVDDPIYASMRVANNRRVNKGKKVAIEQGRKILGLKGNGKGRPLVKSEGEEDGEEQGLEENPSEDGDYSDDPDVEEDDTTKEGQLDLLAPLTTPTLRDRSTLKKPTYMINDSDEVVETVENDLEYATANKSKRQKRSNGRATASVDSTAVSSGYQTEEKDVKPEPEVGLAITQPMGPFPTLMSPTKPSTIQPTGDTFSFQDDAHDNTLPYDQFGYYNGYGGYTNFGYQPMAPPVYAPMQPPAQHQVQFPPPLDMGFNESESYFDSSSNNEPYTSDPPTDETDIPIEFIRSEWLQNHIHLPPQA